MIKYFLLLFCGLSASIISKAQSWKEYYQMMTIYEEKNMVDEAISYGEKAIGAAKKELGERNADYASIVNDVAIKYKNAGYYEKAEPYYLKAAEIRKNIFGENDRQYASSLNNLAILYRNMELFEKAEQFFLKALSILVKNKEANANFYASTLNSLGFLYSFTGNYPKAETLLLEGLQIQKKILPLNHPDIATGTNALAMLYGKMYLLNKAEELYLQSKEMTAAAFGKTSIKYVSVLSNMADLYSKKGEKNKANYYYNEVIEVLKSINKGNKNSINSELLKIYINTQDFKVALQHLLIQKEEIRKEKGEENSLYAQCLANLGFVFSRLYQFPEAELNYQAAGEIYKKLFGKTHTSYINVLGDLSLLHIATDKPNLAEQELKEYSKAKINALTSVLNNFSESETNTFISSNFHLNISNNSLLFLYPGVSKDFYKNNFDLQLLIKSLSLNGTKNTIEVVRNSKNANIKNIYKNWLTNKSILSRQFSLPFINRRPDLKQIEEQTESLEKELNRKSAEFRSQQNALRISMAEVQKNLGEDEAAIEFVSFRLYNKKWTDSTMYAAYIVHKNDSVPIFVPLCEEKQLQKLFDSAGTTSTAMVSKFYRGLEVKNKNAAGALGTELYKLIWQPLEPYLKNVKKVSYSPAGKLYSIAFHALPVDSTTVLMDKYQLQQYTSTRQVVLREQEKQNIVPQNIALFGDASFTLDSLQIVKGKTKTGNVTTSIYTPQNRGTRGGTWSNLPGTTQEVKTIQKVFEQNKITTKIFTQTIASEENLKALSGNSPQILHIATHGFFLPEPDKKRKDNNFNNENTYTLADDPLLRSGLILSGGNYAWSGKTPIDGVEDGIATAYEISQLNLSNTELVVLSACETALGDVKGSEGVFGLQRAFKMAGVKKMIVSLWQVPDKETAELMTAFYTYWMKGKTINDAFTQAQADMRKKYSPFYWAAFVLVE